MLVLLTWPITFSANEWGILNGSHARGFHDTLVTIFLSLEILFPYHRID